MKLALVGPDDSGFWFLENEHGMTWKIVERWEDHSAAASLFGWLAPDGESEGEQMESAREFLMERIGDQIEAPRHIAQHFEELERDAVEEVVTEFLDVQLRSTFVTVEDEGGRIGFKIEGTEIETDDE